MGNSQSTDGNRRKCFFRLDFDHGKLKDWKEPVIVGSVPSFVDHSVCYGPEENCLYSFGGFEYKTKEIVRDLWRCDLSSNSWEKLSTLEKIEPRIAHSMVKYGDRLYGTVF